MKPIEKIIPVIVVLLTSPQSDVFAFCSPLPVGYISSRLRNQKHHTGSKGIRLNRIDDITESVGFGNVPETLSFQEKIDEDQRLFSNLRLREDGNLERREGSTLAATALVFGTTVGAGVLALPAITIDAGFLPSSAVLIAVWIYMAASGLLIAEVNLNTMYLTGRPESSILSMVRSTLGEQGALLAGVAYVFIHYSLLVAYIAQGGAVLDEVLGKLSPQDLHGIGSILFTSVFGGLLYLGSPDQVDNANNALVTVVIGSFTALLLFASMSLQPDLLLHSDWSFVPHAVPTMFVALVFHNVVPSISSQLEGDKKKITQAVVVGSGLPLLMFILWNAAILGTVDPNAVTVSGDGVFDPLAVLRSGTSGSLLGGIVTLFSETAIATSFIGFVVGLKDFAQDLLVKPADQMVTEGNDWFIFTFILVPPLVLAIFSPGIFFSALDYTGTFGISILFGVVPALMAWFQRYGGTDLETLAVEPLVPGGRWTLGFMVCVASSLILDKLLL